MEDPMTDYWAELFSEIIVIDLTDCPDEPKKED